MMKSISIVLLNFNGLDLLKKFLPKLIEFSLEANIVVIDNCSSDNSLSWLNECHSDVQCIKLDKNHGYAGGYNEGLKQVKAKYYCLINNDVLVTKNWLSPLINHFETNPNTAILQPHILDYNKPSHFEYAGAAGGFIDSNGIPFCRGRILNNCEEDFGQYDKTNKIFWASGACFFIRSKVFWKINGFDVDFFAHQEEIDLCWRVFNQNYDITSLGASKVFHLGGATLPVSSRKIYLNHRNSLFMLVKNLPAKDMHKIIFKRLCIDFFIGGVYFVQLNFSSTLAIFNAHIAFYKNYKLMKSKRSLGNLKTDFFYTKSIILKYFLLRILNFSDLNEK